ncbi:EEIG1/EHBP1 N-terminal domain protein [Actinidia chinensis var. chinensis]|uniref:EEIG1/EHBP1 N-terminal domain protein n=1 Tax=Actinidia chinensis var. chinensis TaxID=1590841 RepID=A0A2R6Q2P7_ACTCC|nr:EEIG1/EHBP1 N-terminal domain protein [Actinidia chinensis var. chinensis]
MVVGMMKWSRWPTGSTAAEKKFQVKLKEIKLKGFVDYNASGDEREKVMVVEVKWKGCLKPGFVPFHRKRRKHVSTETVVKKGEPVKWEDEFENACSFPTVPKDHDLGPRVSFTLLYGAKGESKLGVIGKGSLNLAEEITSKMNALIEAKVPINFHVSGVTGEAILSVCLNLVEVRDSHDSPGIVHNSTESKNVDVARGNYNEGKERQKIEEEVSWDDSDESALFGSEGTMTHPVDAYGSGPSSETQLDSVKKAGFFSWKRRRLSFKPEKTKLPPSTKKTIDDDDDVDPHQSGSPVSDSVTPSLRPKLEGKEESSTRGHWEAKELISRDGQAKLKADVFCASFDQRSDKAAGESACTALVAVITHWLQSNQANTPTRSEFDRLIVEGSSEWRKLCDNGDLISRFPDKHFDLDTVLQTGLRPISVLPEKSFIGFFSPEKFESLKGVMSFDRIWDEIKSEADSKETRVYIVSWNDHFFVLRVDANAYYLIDTLGERLYEGCNQAYILRFDDSSLMHAKVETERGGSAEVSGGEPNKPEAKEEEICRGKECCREFIKRFLAAIPLKDLESAEEKEPVSYFALHQRLQIEFNFSY